MERRSVASIHPNDPPRTAIFAQVSFYFYFYFHGPRVVEATFGQSVPFFFNTNFHRHERRFPPNKLVNVNLHNWGASPKREVFFSQKLVNVKLELIGEPCSAVVLLLANLY